MLLVIHKCRQNGGKSVCPLKKKTHYVSKSLLINIYSHDFSLPQPKRISDACRMPGLALLIHIYSHILCLPLIRFIKITP